MTETPRYPRMLHFKIEVGLRLREASKKRVEKATLRGLWIFQRGYPGSWRKHPGTQEGKSEIRRMICQHWYGWKQPHKWMRYPKKVRRNKVKTGRVAARF